MPTLGGWWHTGHMSYEVGPPVDRWNVNLPAVVGVVFVFLLGVIVWVITSSGSDDDTAASATTTGAPRVSVATTTPPATTTPAPMPDLTSVTTSIAPTSTPTITAAPGADPDAVPGDLAIAGRPMLAPPCNDSFITVIASAVGDQASASGIAAVLGQYPTANYLRTDQTCPSLTQDIDGAPIYVVYFGPFPFASDACAARADGTPDAYARQLSDTLGPGHAVNCDDG